MSLQAYPIALVLRVVVALVWSNLYPHGFERAVDGTYSSITSVPFEIGEHVFVLSIVAGIGLAVALNVTGQAFQPLLKEGAAKMRALFSGGIAIIAIFAGKLLRVSEDC